MASAPLELLAIASGRVCPIEAVPDPAFSEKMLGDGIAVEPENGRITAPCAGRVIQAHRAGHAYGILSSGGARLLVHVGIDTVELKGDGFAPKVKEGDQVVTGQTLVEIDRDRLAHRGVNPLTILVVENSDEYPIAWRATGSVKAGQDLLLRLGTTGPPLNEKGEGGNTSKTEIAAEKTAAPAGTGPPENASGTAQVKHTQGLHARPAAQVANTARRFRATVEVLAHGRRADARSLVALMALAVEEGERVEVVAVGPEAGAARDAVIASIETSCLPTQTAAWVSPVPAAKTTESGAISECELAGVVASPGIAVGVITHYRQAPVAIQQRGRDAAYERSELERALRQAAAKIDLAVEQAERRRSCEEAGIFAAHRALVEDPVLFDRAIGFIDGGDSAARAWNRAVSEQCSVLQRSGNALLAERAVDLHDVERQVLSELSVEVAAAPVLAEKSLLVAEELSPADLAALDRARLEGIVLHRGGPTSHVAIVARGLGIPMLVAVGSGLRLVPDGELAILDAEHGRLHSRPTAEQLAAAGAEIERRRTRRIEARRAAGLPAATTDGQRIEVAANVSNLSEVAELVAQGADGVGLLRTELLFMANREAPSEDEQRQIYQQVADALQGRSVIIRTLDVGADKPLPYLPMPHEENPALGQRGIRLGLARRELLREQLRACLRVTELGRVRIMLPMVADLEEIIQARDVLRLAAAELGLNRLPVLGVMIETPAAALLADQLSGEVDFLSLGTNDLTQYCLAMDRGNAEVAHRLDDLHPAVLRLIAATTEGARRHGKWVGVCGGMASEPLAIPLLVGLGVTELSVSPPLIAEVKQVIRRLELPGCRQVATQALALTSAEAVRQHLRNTFRWLDGTVT